MAPPPSLLLLLLGIVGRGLCFSVTDACLHLHTDRLILCTAGEDVLLHCQFQYKRNFTLDEVHVLWGKEIATDEYQALVIFDGQNVKRFRENAFFSTGSLQDGKVSMLMKNVTTADNGAYLCDVTVNATNSKARMQMQVAKTGHVCKEDLQLENIPKVQESNTADGFTNRSLGAIVAVVMVLGIVLSTVAFVQCKKRRPVPRDSA
ncbi:butyrophilin subfamily 2 member A2-like [Ambystoma mexicanum]|uniref:butyrophilin subfamily 2 member A2-like n=1 Tax=Ambystoma mexicanum TaxID=8296 RepID=UPI0037E8EA9D